MPAGAGRLTGTANGGRHDLGDPHGHQPGLGPDVEVDDDAAGQRPGIGPAGVADGDADDADAVHAVEHGPAAEALADLREDDDAERVGDQGERVEVGEVVDGESVPLGLGVVLAEDALVGCVTRRVSRRPFPRWQSRGVFYHSWPGPSRALSSRSRRQTR